MGIISGVGIICCRGSLAALYRSNVNSIDDDNLRAESDDDEYAFTVGGGNTGGTINVLVGGVAVRMLIDSGASTNVIDK